MRAEKEALVPDDYLTEDDLRALEIDPADVRARAPHATEYRALDGARCWAAIDLAHLFGANGGGQ